MGRADRKSIDISHSQLGSEVSDPLDRKLGRRRRVIAIRAVRELQERAKLSCQWVVRTEHRLDVVNVLDPRKAPVLVRRVAAGDADEWRDGIAVRVPPKDLDHRNLLKRADGVAGQAVREGEGLLVGVKPADLADKPTVDLHI